MKNKLYKLLISYSWKEEELKKINKFFKKEILKINKNKNEKENIWWYN